MYSTNLISRVRWGVVGVGLLSAVGAGISQPSRPQSKAQIQRNPEAIQICRTLQEALAAAYVNNPTLKEERQKVFALHDRIVQPLAKWKPTVELNCGLNRTMTTPSGNDIDRARNDDRQDLVTQQKIGNATPDGSDISQRTAQLEARYTLFEGGQAFSSFHAEDFGIKAAWSRLYAKEQDIFLEVIKAFLEVLTIQAEVRSRQAAQAAYKQAFETASEQNRVGSESLTQVKNAESSYLQAQSDCEQARQSLSEAQTNFMLLTGCPAGELKALEFPESPTQDVDQLVDYAKDHHPTILSLVYEYRATQEEKKRSLGAMMPKVDVFVRSTRTDSFGSQKFAQPDGLNSQYNPTETQKYQTDNTVGLQIRVPIYDGGIQRASMRISHENSLSKRVAIDKAYKEFRKIFQDRLRGFRVFRENIRLLSQQVESRQLALQGTIQEKEAGSKVLLDELNARNALLQAEIGLQRMKQQFFLTYFQILSSRGDLTPQFLKIPVKIFDLHSHYEQAKNRF
jgi:outer membrane protein